jgi:hypothetical protein
LSSKINELKTKFEKARTVLTSMPGIDMSLSEQEAYYESLLKQYKHESDLIKSYKEMCKFDTSKLENVPNFEQDLMTNSATSSSNALNAIQNEEQQQTSCNNNGQNNESTVEEMATDQQQDIKTENF